MKHRFSHDAPAAPASSADKLSRAKSYLQRRGIYILDHGTPKPKWGDAHNMPPVPNAAMLEREMNADRRRQK